MKKFRLNFIQFAIASFALLSFSCSSNGNKGGIITEEGDSADIGEKGALLVDNENPSLGKVESDSTMEVYDDDEYVVESDSTMEVYDDDEYEHESAKNNYIAIGTNGTMQLEKFGVVGDPMSPDEYWGRYITEDETNFQFRIYPHSKFGKTDYAVMTECYNYKKSLINTSLAVPSYVVLEGKKYKVEGALLYGKGRDPYNIGRYVLPSTIKRIDLSGWRGMKEVVLNDGIEEISQRAFRNCVDMESVVLPKTLKKIGKLAFYNCMSLKKIRIPASVVDVCEGGAFVGLNKGVTIEVEKGCEALNDLKPIDVYIRNDHYKFNPDDINIIYLN